MPSRSMRSGLRRGVAGRLSRQQEAPEEIRAAGLSSSGLLSWEACPGKVLAGRGEGKGVSLN